MNDNQLKTLKEMITEHNALLDRATSEFNLIQDFLEEITDDETAIDLMCEMQELDNTQTALNNFKLSFDVLKRELKREGVM